MICRGCLKEMRSGEICSRCRKELFDGVNVPLSLPFSRPEFNALRRNLSGRLSISGVQNKVSLTVHDGRFEAGSSQGTYILKPRPLTQA